MSAEDLAVLAGEATGEMVVAENAPGDVQAEALRVQAASTLYDVLGVTKAATEIEIRRNYRKVCSHQPGMLRPVRTRLAVEPAHFFTRLYSQLAILLHPDKTADPVAAESFKRVGQAMHHLSDGPRRANYDASLLGAPLVQAPTNFYGKWKTPTFFAAPTGPRRSTSGTVPAGSAPTKQKKAKWSNRVSPYANLASPPQAAAAAQAAAAQAASASTTASTPWWSPSSSSAAAPVSQAYSFQCPNCQTTLQVNLDPNQVGSQKVSIKCPHCQCVNEAVVQAQNQPAATPDAAAAAAAAATPPSGYAPGAQPHMTTEPTAEAATASAAALVAAASAAAAAAAAGTGGTLPSAVATQVGVTEVGATTGGNAAGAGENGTEKSPIKPTVSDVATALETATAAAGVQEVVAEVDQGGVDPQSYTVSSMLA